MDQLEHYLAHCLWMARLDPAYARKAAKWYALTLEIPELVARLETELRKPSSCTSHTPSAPIVTGRAA